MGNSQCAAGVFRLNAASKAEAQEEEGAIPADPEGATAVEAEASIPGAVVAPGTEVTDSTHAEAPGAIAIKAEASCEETQSTASGASGAEEAAVIGSVLKTWKLETLEAEVEALRLHPPPYVTNIGSLKVPNMVCSTEQEMLQVSNGIWDLTMYVSGSDKNSAYDFPFLICLRFDRKWPEVPPDVRFNCVMHHAFTHEGSMLPSFYQAMPRNANGCISLSIVVEAIHLFLIDPFQAVGVGADRATLPPRFIQSVQMQEMENLNRIEIIKRYSTMALHTQLFEFPPRMRQEWFDPAFWEAYQVGTPEAWRSLLSEALPGKVLSFPIFTLEFCDMLLAEVFNFYASGLEARRPNSMNNYGIILNDIGLEPFITQLQKMLQPIGDIFFPGAGSVWDGHHCFIVRYREGEDLGLDMHIDDSDVTFNTCLGLDFDGAGLKFCGFMGSETHRKQSCTYKHQKGGCVVHLGRLRHGADDITSGERLNIILWNHSSTYRSSKEYKDVDYVQEIGPPDPVCLSYTHDRDFGSFKEYPAGKEHFEGRGWCPPEQFEYEDFKPEVALGH